MAIKMQIVILIAECLNFKVIFPRSLQYMRICRQIVPTTPVSARLQTMLIRSATPSSDTFCAEQCYYMDTAPSFDHLASTNFTR
jgi:hypothetical protein